MIPLVRVSFAFMAAKKKTASPKKKPISKTSFVKSLPESTPGAEVVKKAKAAGLNISLGYVYSIRAKAHAKRRPKAAPTAAAAVPAKRGPGRPPKSASMSNGNGSVGVGNRTAGGLEAAIEAIVERKVNEILKGKLGALFG